MHIEFWKKIEKLMYAKNEEKILIQMCSQARTTGTKLLEVHGVRKDLNPNLRPEKNMPCLKRYNRKAAHRSGKSRIEKKAGA